MSADPTTKTALDLITGALRKLGQYAPGETLSAADANDALDTFNGMLDLMSNEQMAVYSNTETIITLTPGKATYSVGLTGDIPIERPLRIVRMYSRLTSTGSTVDFPCQQVAVEQYASIGLKNQPGPWAKVGFYNPSYPLAELILWPVPSQSVEFHLWTETVLSSLLTLNTPLNMPRGYFLGLQYPLAELLAPEYGMAVPPDVRRLSKEFRALLKAQNSNPLAIAPVDPALIGTAPATDAGWILHGGF